MCDFITPSSSTLYESVITNRTVGCVGSIIHFTLLQSVNRHSSLQVHPIRIIAVDFVALKISYKIQVVYTLRPQPLTSVYVSQRGENH